MLFSVEQAFVEREEIRTPLKTPAWEAKATQATACLGCSRFPNTAEPRFNEVPRDWGNISR